MKPTVFLIGLGSLGAVILELLAREPALGQIIVGSRNTARGEARCNLARLGAVAQGYSPLIRFLPLDLNHQDQVSAVIEREAPDLILSTATMQTWWWPDLLPPDQADLIKSAGFGVWLPVHLTLTLKLMKAVRAAGYKGLTLTAPFPDVVNPVLDRLDLAPTCGIGNLDEIVPKIRLLAAERLQVPLETVEVWLVAHHALQPAAFGEAVAEVPPYFLRIEHGGQDVTEAIRAEELMLAPYPIPPGPATHFLTAGSAVRLVRALLSNRESRLHAPAPNGLPGGYPVIASREGVRPLTIPGLSLAQAMAINERSHRFDGIERIEADGTVVFRSEAVAVLQRALGYGYDRLPPDQAEPMAIELMDRFDEFARQYGVELKQTNLF